MKYLRQEIIKVHDKNIIECLKFDIHNGMTCDITKELSEDIVREHFNGVIITTEIKDNTMLIKFDKEAPQIRILLNEYLMKIKDNEFAYYLAFMAELYDYNPNFGLEVTSENLRKQKALSYLNKAIELDPKNPKHFLAIRGVGYIFEC